MALDLTILSDEVFDDWLGEATGHISGDGLNDEGLVALVGATLRETAPEARARGLIDLANLCYAMADKTLGSLAPSARCFEIVVSATQHQ